MTASSRRALASSRPCFRDLDDAQGAAVGELGPSYIPNRPRASWRRDFTSRSRVVLRPEQLHGRRVGRRFHWDPRCGVPVESGRDRELQQVGGQHGRGSRPQRESAAAGCHGGGLRQSIPEGQTGRQVRRHRRRNRFAVPSSPRAHDLRGCAGRDGRRSRGPVLPVGLVVGILANKAVSHLSVAEIGQCLAERAKAAVGRVQEPRRVGLSRRCQRDDGVPVPTQQRIVSPVRSRGRTAVRPPVWSGGRFEWSRRFPVGKWESTRERRPATER